MKKVLTVQSITQADGNRPYRVKMSDGKEYSTFKDEVVANLTAGLKIEADVSEKPNGRYTNYYLNAWNFTTAPEPESNAKEATAVEDAQASKERAIAMQSCISSAAHFWGQRITEDLNYDLQAVKTLATEFYAMVQSARAGSTVDRLSEVFPEQ
jgi:hypothetical protein